MIADDMELQSTLQRITWFQQQIAQLRKVETNPINYRAATSGFLAEIDRMQMEVREYLCVLPTQITNHVEKSSRVHSHVEVVS